MSINIIIINKWCFSVSFYIVPAGKKQFTFKLRERVRSKVRKCYSEGGRKREELNCLVGLFYPAYIANPIGQNLHYAFWNKFGKIKLHA